jgi:hypothetical protein
MTRGRMNVAPSQVFDRDLPPTENLTPMWQPSLMAAVLILPFDIFLRRVMVDFAEIWSGFLWLLRWLGAHLVPFRRARPIERDATTAALMDAKERVVTEREGQVTAEDKSRLQEALSRVKAQRDLVDKVESAPQRPRVSPRASGGGEAKPVAKKPDDSDYTSALLKAKKRAKKKM